MLFTGYFTTKNVIISHRIPHYTNLSVNKCFILRKNTYLIRKENWISSLYYE